MPDLAGSAKAAAMMDVPGMTNGAKPRAPQFSAPRRPPPLIPTTRPTYGEQMDALQLSPIATTAPGETTPTRPSPSATTSPMQAGGFFTTIPGRPTNVNAEPIPAVPSVMVPATVADADRAALARGRKHSESRAAPTEGAGSGSTLSKSRSWFSRRSKK
ncbi:hypothetical protein LPJ59_002699 [Coemansia sp. RSA 2399]|nr:hypothetical protein LPJ59_002699 [Coemansia sp. RSA 2399]